MRKPRMTVAFVAQELMNDFPDLFCQMEPFARKKRLIGIINDAMSRGTMAWVMHRGQRRITPEGLDGFVEGENKWIEETCTQSRDAADEAQQPITERYPLPKPKRRKRKHTTRIEDTGPSLGEID